VVLRELVVSESDNLKESQDNRVEVNIKDIGFGASQILPVIIACLDADDNAFIIIEQPELHLHPEAQASVADLFIECVSALTADERKREIKEEKGKEERNEERVRERVRRRCLIETHSEHILLRLQLRMAGGKPRYFDSGDADDEEITDRSPRGFELAGRDFGLIFVLRNKKSGVSKIEYIDADPYGRLVGDMTEFSSFFDRAFLDSSVFSIASEESVKTVETEAVKTDEAGYWTSHSRKCIFKKQLYPQPPHTRVVLPLQGRQASQKYSARKYKSKNGKRENIHQLQTG
jgi:hypothetical protein